MQLLINCIRPFHMFASNQLFKKFVEISPYQSSNTSEMVQHKNTGKACQNRNSHKIYTSSCVRVCDNWWHSYVFFMTKHYKAVTNRQFVDLCQSEKVLKLKIIEQYTLIMWIEINSLVNSLLLAPCENLLHVENSFSNNSLKVRTKLI